MISGHGNIETAVSAIKRGAYDYIEKPFNADRLVLIAERALEASKLKREVKDLRQRSGDALQLVGDSSVINQLGQTIERVAPTNSRILITGPSGSGKELVARTIHNRSARAAGPFVVLNAATITPERMEEERFGIRGRKPRTAQRKVGALEEAHGGTLYLDEIADMPGETQSKILRVLVDQKFQRVNGGTKVHVDVRIISSSAPQSGGRDRRGPVPRGPVPPARRRPAPGAVPVGAARGHPRPGRFLHGPDLRGDGPAEAAHRRRRHGRPPGP